MSVEAAVEPRAQRSTGRFKAKQQAVLDAASALINERGAGGLTLAAVAEAVGLNTASVTYYYPRRDDLALAAYAHALDRIEAMVEEAGEAPDPRARLARYVALNVERFGRVLEGEERPITVLSDIRTMSDPVRRELSDRYRVILRRVRGFFGEDGDTAAKRTNIARAHLLLEAVYWMPAWLQGYAVSDFPRIIDRLSDLLARGLRPANSPLALPDPAEPASDEGPQQRFLQAATRLINERGYRGASVERIAAELNVTKGSFYHHLPAKEDLVIACFRRSFDLVTAAQQAAEAAGGRHAERLLRALSQVIDVQFSDAGPLLRTTALQALPLSMRGDVIEGSNRIARRFAGTIADGIADGSLRAVDPLLAAQLLMPAINSAYELRGWAEAGEGRAAARDTYVSLMLGGLTPER